MAGPNSSLLWRVLRAPFARRTRAELAYVILSVPLALVALVFTVPMLANGALRAMSAPGARKLGAASRFLARALLEEDVPPPPPPLRPNPWVRVQTPDAGRRGAVYDRTAWRARGYFGLKLPVALIGLLAAAGCWLGGLFYLTYPIWWELANGRPWLPGGVHIATLAGSFAFLPAGAALLLAAPWLTHAVTVADRALIRRLLGPGSAALAERVRDLEQTRAHAVDDSAARLRSIERDLHDGAQAQLVALAMKLGLAKEKLGDEAPPDLTRVTQLVDDAHRSAIEAIAELRTLARGIHPSVLDNGLADALTTLAARSAVPVELITDIPERPSAAIETIAYFSAAELLANVAKHSGARRATLEAVHVPGLLRIRVTDDGHGGASPVPAGGLRGLAERVRTVDGRLDIDSPAGGPTVVTVELPSRA
jgi:signal transduction histidine kinase